MPSTAGRTGHSFLRRRALLLLGCALLVSACSKGKETAAGPVEEPRPAVVREADSAGARLFKERCLDCHAIDGHGGEAGPDLSEVTVRGNRDYVESMMTSPEAHFPGTSMPSFQGRLTEREIHEISGYVCGE